MGFWNENVPRSAGDILYDLSAHEYELSCKTPRKDSFGCQTYFVLVALAALARQSGVCHLTPPFFRVPATRDLLHSDALQSLHEQMHALSR